MVEISVSVSGEGSGWVTAPDYSTGAFWRTRRVGWTRESGSGWVFRGSVLVLARRCMASISAESLILPRIAKFFAVDLAAPLYVRDFLVA
jgi:hypothetical protein